MVRVCYTATKTAGSHDVGMYQLHISVSSPGGGTGSPQWAAVEYGKQATATVETTGTPASVTLELIPEEQADEM